MYYFEIHITVKIKEEADLNTFKSTCEALKVKTVIIDLPTIEKQVMTSHTIKVENLEEAKKVSSDLRSQIEQAGLEVDREKIEVEPRYIEETNTSFLYLETHVLCNTKSLTEVRKSLIKGCHISRNEFKPDLTFITFRTTTVHPQEIKIFEGIVNLWNKMGYAPETKVEWEYAVYDSNEALDSKWINHDNT